MRRIIYIIMSICAFAMSANAQYLEVVNNNIGKVHKRYEASEIDSVIPFGKYRDPNVELFAKEREILTEFYNATGGDNWITNTNWCTDAPLSEWYGLTCDDIDGRVYYISLGYNNLTGQIPGSIFELPFIDVILLDYNNLVGELPEQMGYFTGGSISLLGNRLSGTLPEFLVNLEQTHKEGDRVNQYSISLGDNQFEGTVPEVYSELKHCYRMDFMLNNLYGDIPQSVQETKWFKDSWSWCLLQIGDLMDGGKGFNHESLNMKLQDISMTDCLGNTVDNSTFAKNKLSLLIYLGYDDSNNVPYITHEKLSKLYYDYHKKGLEVYLYGIDRDWDKEKQKGTKVAYQLPYQFFTLEGVNSDQLYPPYYPWPDLIDSEGKFVLNGCQTIVEAFKTNNLDVANNQQFEKLYSFVQEQLGDPDPEEPQEVIVPGIYRSTDYSRDGQVTCLQEASEGNGIDLVLMCDLFTDRMIADGSYEKAVAEAMENFFKEEPYKSFRHLFNVYMVEVVSELEFLKGRIYFDADVAMEYAKKAIGEARLGEATIAVLQNADFRSYTALSISTDVGTDYASGTGVSFTDIKDEDPDFMSTVFIHETGGHAFAKLHDEYIEMYGLSVGDYELETVPIFHSLGLQRNVDLTNDPDKILWSDFLKDERYVADGLGIFEGALYEYGIYRPTENSIMNDLPYGFNAPSREAIYYRIHKLAYGKEWQYDRDEFKAWDEKNLKANRPARAPRFRLTPELEQRLKELHRPPVIYLDGKPVGTDNKGAVTENSKTILMRQ